LKRHSPRGDAAHPAPNLFNLPQAIMDQLSDLLA